MRRLDLFVARLALGLSLAASSSAAADLPLKTQEQVQKASALVGFCMVQERSIKAIEQYPALRHRALLARATFAGRFPGACENTQRALRAKMRAAGVVAKFDEVMAQATEQLPTPRSYADAIAALEELKARGEGHVDAKILPLLLSATRPNLADPSWEMRQGWLQKYSTAGHPNSQGLHVEFSLPASWKSFEGQRPHILNRWVNMDGVGPLQFLLQINGPVEGLSRNWAAEFSPASVDELCADMMPAESMTTSGRTARAVTVEGQKATICGYNGKTERMGVTINMHTEVLAFPVNDRMVLLMSMQHYQNARELGAAERNTKALLQGIGLTLVLPGRYR